MTEARASFQIALAINPHLEGVREVVSQLGTLPRSDLHSSIFLSSPSSNQQMKRVDCAVP